MQAQIHPAVTLNLSAFTDLQRTSSTARTTSSCTAEAGTLMNGSGSMESITMESAVVVVSRKGCCMSHVVTQLLSSLGVNPRVVEVHDQLGEDDCSTPAIFIGGRLLGGVDRLLAAHITGNLVPQLKAAGALWL